MRSLARILLLPACLGLGQGCLAEAEVESWRSRIGEGATCDPVEPTCWPELDRQAMAAVHLALLDAGSGTLAQRTFALCTAASHLAALSHKLEPERAQWIAESAGKLCGATELDEVTLAAAATQIVDGALVPLEGPYLSAFMEPVQEDFERAAAEEGAWGAAWGTAELPISSSWPEGVQGAARVLGESGLLGMTYVQMLATAGVFDRDYARANAELFGGEVLTEQERVDRILADAVRRAAWIGLGTGAATAVPVAGLAISIAVRTQLVAALQAEVALRLAEARGLDPREQDTMLVAISTALSGGVLPVPLDSIVSAAGEVAVQPLGAALARAVIGSLAARMGADLARQGAGRVVLGLLGTATLGLVSGAAGAGIESLMMYDNGQRFDAVLVEYRRLRSR